jgi:hypothetical protein
MDLSDQAIKELCQTEEGVIKVIEAFEIPKNRVWVFLRPNSVIDQMVEDGKLAHKTLNGVNVYAITPVKPTVHINWGDTSYQREN